MRKLFVYHLKQIIRQRDALIWGFSLPIVLLLIFSVVFRPVDMEEVTLPVSRIGLLADKEPEFADFLTQLDATTGKWKGQQWTEKKPDKKTQIPLVYGQFSSLEEAREAMNAGAIDVLVLDAAEGKYETRTARSYVLMVVQQILRSYQTTVNVGEAVASLQALSAQQAPPAQESQPGVHPAAETEQAPPTKDSTTTAEGVNLFEVNQDLRKGGVNEMLSYQFACIAYIAFYAFNTGNNLLNNINANQSTLGLREQVSPLQKPKSFLLHFGAHLVIYAGFTLFLYLLLRLLGVDAATKTDALPFLLLLYLGQCCGMVMGAVFAALFPEAKNLRQAISILVPLFFGFLSGMMISSIRTTVQDVAPLVDQLNPVSMVSDGVYGLYTQGVGEIYQTAMLHLAIIFVLFLGITAIALRRDRYESL